MEEEGLAGEESGPEASAPPQTVAGGAGERWGEQDGSSQREWGKLERPMGERTEVRDDSEATVVVTRPEAAASSRIRASEPTARSPSPLRFSPKPVFGSFSDKFLIDDLESQLRIKTRELRASEEEVARLRERLATAEKDKVQAREVAIVLRDMLSRRGQGPSHKGSPAPGPTFAPGGSPGRPGGALGSPLEMPSPRQLPTLPLVDAGAESPVPAKGLPEPRESRPVSRWSLDSGVDFTLPTPPVKGIFRPPPQPPSAHEILSDLQATQEAEKKPGRVPHFAQPTSSSSLKRARMGSLSGPAGQGGPTGGGAVEEGVEAAGMKNQSRELSTLTKQMQELQKRAASHKDIEGLKKEVEDLRQENRSLAATLNGRVSGGGEVLEQTPGAKANVTPLPVPGGDKGEEARFLSALESEAHASPLGRPAAPKSEPAPARAPEGGAVSRARATPRPGTTSRTAVPLEKKIGRKPTAQETSELIERAIGKLKKRFRANGIELPLERLQGCMYALAGQKIHLLVVGGKLSVRTGGGHLDFLAYLSQKRLRISAFADAQAAP